MKSKGLRDKLAAMVKEAGFILEEMFGKNGRGKGSVAVKYRDKD